MDNGGFRAAPGRILLIAKATAETATIARPAPGAVVTLGFDADGKRVRQKVSGKTKAEVKHRLKVCTRSQTLACGRSGLRRREGRSSPAELGRGR